MSLPETLVTIHPYFKTHPGKEARAQEIMEKFVAKTHGEPLCLFYEFTVLGEAVFCREGYIGARGVLDHLQNVGEILGEMLTISELTRLEFHGPAAEIDLLREPLGHLNPDFYVLRCGVPR